MTDTSTKLTRRDSQIAMRGIAVAASLTALALAVFSCSDDEGAPATGSSSGGEGGAGGSLPGPPNWNRKVTPPTDEDAKTQRSACGYGAGALPAETQGASRPNGSDIPVDHILILMQENRSFDHYFQKLPEFGQPDVEVAPPDYVNQDKNGADVAPFHDERYCFVDTNHEWSGAHDQFNGGLMDGFIRTNDGHGSPPPHPLPDSSSGVRAMGYYDGSDLPFYYWLANEYSIADHYFCSLLGPTWPNRQFLYAASSRGATTNTLSSFVDQNGACSTDADCGGAQGSCMIDGHACTPPVDVGCGCTGACTKDEDCGIDAPVGSCGQGGVCAPVGRTLFHYLEQRQVDWKVYASGTPGFALAIDAFLDYGPDHQHDIEEYFADAAAGTLPAVAFIDSHIGDERFDQDDEHPPATPFPGQLFVAKVVDALQKSPEWSSSALFITYDEHGGLYDHVPPPNACPPGDRPPSIEPGDPVADFDRYGRRAQRLRPHVDRALRPVALRHPGDHRTRRQRRGAVGDVRLQRGAARDAARRHAPRRAAIEDRRVRRRLGRVTTGSGE